MQRKVAKVKDWVVPGASYGLDSYFEALPPIPQNVTVSGGRAFKEVIRLK